MGEDEPARSLPHPPDRPDPAQPQPPLAGAVPGTGQGLLRAAVEGTDALMIVLGADGLAVLANPALTRTTGWSEAELCSTPFWDLFVAPEDVEGAKDAFARAITEGLAFPQEGDWVDRWGGRRRIWMQNSVLREAGGRPYAVVTVGVDVTDQRRHEAALRQRADTDALTGLRNRGSLFAALTAALDEPAGVGCGLLFCDLDGLKQANDTHGHHVGDLLLVETAARLLRVTRDEDVVARFGGDEFVILCPAFNHEALAVLAARVEAEVAQPVHTPAGPIRVGVSIGTAIGHPGTAPDDAIWAADRQMYRVKSARRPPAPDSPEPRQP
jgi:diguanylate cyclase (GGDEF)-like protein/PAS domain S-box-containing protein